MGVSGSGKSTIGRLLAARLDYPFLDGDDFHPPRNITRMRAGIPLSDTDRQPWLERLHSELQHRPRVVLACSALKASYRTILEQGLDLTWVCLAAPPELIRQRLESRPDHFMPAALLDSQFATWEPPQDAIRTDISYPPEDVTDEIVRALERP